MFGKRKATYQRNGSGEARGRETWAICKKKILFFLFPCFSWLSLLKIWPNWFLEKKLPYITLLPYAICKTQLSPLKAKDVSGSHLWITNSGTIEKACQTSNSKSKSVIYTVYPTPYKTPHLAAPGLEKFFLVFNFMRLHVYENEYMSLQKYRHCQY